MPSHYPAVSVIHNYIQYVASWNVADCEKVWWHAEGHREYYRVCDLLGWRLPAGLEGGDDTVFFRQVIEFLHKSKALYLPREWSLFVAGCAQRGRSNQGREGWWGWALTRKHFIRYSPLPIDSLPTRSFLSRLFAKFEGQRPWVFYAVAWLGVWFRILIFSCKACVILFLLFTRKGWEPQSLCTEQKGLGELQKGIVVHNATHFSILQG